MIPSRESPWGLPEGETREPKAHHCNDRAEDVIRHPDGHFKVQPRTLLRIVEDEVALTSEICLGKFAIWMLPQLFPYAANFPIQKFLQSPSPAEGHGHAMAWVAAVFLVIHAFLSWLTIIKLGWGLVGAAVTLNLSWWLVVFGEFGYTVVCCTDTWTGFSWLAFMDL
ncbi:DETOXIFICATION 33 protein [Nymphaea thermarum]|nr:DETOXIFICATION 33 protein [Nymphaea thermarum]